jgi:hypothetical protein
MIRISDPTTHFFTDLDPPMQQNDTLRHPPFHFDADPDPAFNFDADPYPAFHFDVYPDPDPASQNGARRACTVRCVTTVGYCT